MKTLRFLLMFAVTVAGPFLSAGEKPASTDARSLLEKGVNSGAMPDGMVVKVSACLGQPDAAIQVKHGSQDFLETWEFTAGRVQRITLDSDGKTGVSKKAESRPFDTGGLCKILLDGKAIEIAAEKGVGPNMGFVGSGYQAGTRSIEVSWNGKTVLSLLETNGATLELYRKSDARAFGLLYERLAKQARALFNPQATKNN